MLETMLDGHVIFVLMGVLTVIGIVSKCIVNVALKRMVHAAGNMSKSNHPLMRLVRAKFEHASMVSDKVENVQVFVDKHLYEYKILGIRLHGWRRLEKTAAALCLAAGAAGAGLEYSVRGMSDMVWKTGAAGAGLGALVFLIHLMTDEKYQMKAAQNYMVDYLENVCRHRYEKEKAHQKEIKVLAQDGNQAEFGVMPPENHKGSLENVGSVNAASEREREAQDKSYDTYNVRKREPEGEKSAVDVFNAAELIADEAISAFREAESRRGGRESKPESRELIKESGRAEMKEQTRESGRTEVRETARADSKDEAAADRREALRENIVELPAAEFVRETMESSGKELSEPPRSVTRAAAQRQISTKDRQPKRDRQEDVPDKDVVIRRILEEFMA